MGSQNFNVAQISFSPTGLKADEVILEACTYIRDQEITIVAEDDYNEFFTHACAGVDEHSETGERKTVTLGIKRDYDVLKVLLPNKYGDGGSGYIQKNNAGSKSQKHEIKIRPLGAGDDVDAMLFTAFIVEMQNTTATAAGTDYVEIVMKATMIGIDGVKKDNFIEYGIDFPVS